MFITPDELKSAINEYQVAGITASDNSIVLMDIAAAEAEMKSYLRSYNTQAVFTATGEDRNPLLVELCKSIAVWYLVRRCNVDIIYSQVKERYDRAIEWLTKVSEGKIAPELPLAIDEGGDTKIRFRTGSNLKFNHSF